MFQITPLAAFEDNYIWAICQPQSQYCILVDPGDADIALSFLQQQQKELCAVLITHHHADHTGGLATLLKRWPMLRAIGPDAERQRIPLLTEWVNEGDIVDVPQMNTHFRVLDVPGHTAGHIAFYQAPALFCGDTLFSAGCGRLLGGSAEQLFSSLQKLASLPADTQIYCTHEYTLANIKFARQIEPDNKALVEYQQRCQQQRMAGQPTLPATLATELAVNPFLRCNNNELQARWQQESALELFRYLRQQKDQFKG